MPLSNHVPKGTLLTCNFSPGFSEPEMVKRRPVIVLSPEIKARPNLLTVVAISTTEPDPVMPYHTQTISIPGSQDPLKATVYGLKAIWSMLWAFTGWI